MRVDLAGTPGSEARPRSPRLTAWCALLGLVVIATAAIAGTARFGGPRWVPDLSVSGHAGGAHTLPLPAHRPLRPLRHGSGGTGDLGQILLGVVIAVVVAIVALLLYRIWAGRRRRGVAVRTPVVAARLTSAPAAVEPEPDTPALRSGIELALERLDEPREPADAIVRAWLGLQETAEQSGIVRGEAETPTEFTSRILSRAFTDDRAVRTLLRLYLRARFGDRPMSAEDVAAARSALRALVADRPATGVA